MIITIFTANMDRAVAFYTEILGCKLEYRFGDHWAQLKSDDGATIGLHPAAPQSPAGIKGSIQLGISVKENIRKVVEEMKAKGVKFNGPVGDDKQILFANFDDPDGNPLYLAEVKRGDWSQNSSAA
jgi:catechol 2,3-dioxygenase-like lactoylglutathione lyase family enzyme